MEATSRPRRRDGVLAQTAGDTVVLLVPETGEYFTLEEVGARIWDLADGTRSVAQIADTLADEYDAPRATIETDAIDFVRELAGARLLVDATAPA
jgi:pyrroloquinoline quinone biosynthesis protein D